MEIANQLFICFGIPLMGLFLYCILFAKIENKTVFYIGVFSTMNFLLWFSELFTIRYWGMSILNILGFLYLLIVAPVLSVGVSYWVIVRRDTLTLAHFVFPLMASMSYVAIFWGIPLVTLIFVNVIGRIFTME
jgi:hypothetical protein